jgi:hypothetical protein
MTIQCWICEKNANTGEHLLKRSDLSKIYKGVSQKHPLYFHTGAKKNIPIGSLNNERFKSKALLCSDCNNRLTQPYDKAWEKFSGSLQDNFVIYRKSRKIDTKKIFPGASEKSLLDVHLFFLKLFGCRIKEHQIPIDINEFSQCILKRSQHPNVFLKFGFLDDAHPRVLAALTPIQAVNQPDQGTVFAAWFYCIDKVFVEVIFNKVNNNIALKHSWHPNQKCKRLEFIDLKLERQPSKNSMR